MSERAYTEYLVTTQRVTTERHLVKVHKDYGHTFDSEVLLQDDLMKKITNLGGCVSDRLAQRVNQDVGPHEHVRHQRINHS